MNNLINQLYLIIKQLDNFNSHIKTLKHNLVNEYNKLLKQNTSVTKELPFRFSSPIIIANSDLDDLTSLFEPKFRYETNKKVKYPAYKRPEEAPSLYKGDELESLLKDSSKNGIFSKLGLNGLEDQMYPNKELLKEADNLLEYLRIMRYNNRKFYLLIPQKVLLEKYFNNKITTGELGSYSDFMNHINNDLSKIEILTPKAFSKYFRELRWTYPTLRYKMIDKLNILNKKVVHTYVFGRTFLECESKSIDKNNWVLC